MKFKITKTSDSFNDEGKQRIEEFNSLDELMKFISNSEYVIIIRHYSEKEMPILEIYDGYRD